MDHKISILFYSRIASKNNENLVPVYMRITVNGKRYEQSTNRFVDLQNWCANGGRMKGSHTDAKNLNNYLDSIRNKVHITERNMIRDGKKITYESFKDEWLGVHDKSYMILEIFKQHNEEVAMLIGKDFSASTLARYKTSLMHTQNFIMWKYKVDDLDILKLNYEFISNYAFWLKSIRNCNHNSTMKYLANFKKIALICLKNGWIQRDPFVNFKLTKREVDRPFLTSHELKDIVEKKFGTERLKIVKDIFLFSCYTGLAYADVKKLKRSDLGIGVDGEKWIFTKRQKTDIPSRIPLLPFSESLINKYHDHPQCIINDRLLPVLSNQKMNSYLKEIADTCYIHKNLTFHIARHTFATTVTLSNGVPIETVSKMLGHKNLRTTQHYAKILDLKVSEDMGLLRKRLWEQQLLKEPEK